MTSPTTVDPGVDSRGRFAPWLAVVVLSVATALQTIPSPSKFRSRFAGDAGDPLFQMWTLETGSRNLFHPGRWFESNIFWPRHDTLSWSDSLLTYAPFFRAVRAAGLGTVAAYNVVLFTASLAGCLVLYGFARWLGASRPAATVGAMLFGLTPFRGANITHVQLTGVVFVIAALWLFAAWLEQRRLWQTVLLGVMIGLTWYTAAYLFLVLVIALPVYLVVALLADRGSSSEAVTTRLVGMAGGLIVAVATAVVLMLPSLGAYIDLQRQGVFDRSDHDVIAVEQSSFALPDSLVYRLIGRGGPLGDVNGLFPGVVLTALTAGAFVVLVRRRLRQQGREARTTPAGPDGTGAVGQQHSRWATAGLPLTVSAVAVALVAAGPRRGALSLWFRGLRAVVPGFRSVREATRFSILALVVAALASAWVLDELTGWLARRPTANPLRWGAARAAVIAPLAIGMLGFVEVADRPLAGRFPHEYVSDRTYATLGRLPRGPVVEAPLPSFDSLMGQVIAPRQLRSLVDGMPRPLGYSGNLPPEQRALLESVYALPERRVVRALRDYGVRHLLIHGAAAACAGAYSPPEMKQIRARFATDPSVERLTDSGRDLIVTLRPVVQRDRHALDRLAVKTPGPHTRIGCEPFAANEARSARYRSSEPFGLLASVRGRVPAVVDSGKTLSAEVDVTNTGLATWLPAGSPRGAVSIFARVQRVEGQRHIEVACGCGLGGLQPIRAAGEQPLAPGSRQQLALPLGPFTPGAYELELDLVADGVVPFSSAGTPVTRVPFRVADRLTRSLTESRSLRATIDVETAPDQRQGRDSAITVTARNVGTSPWTPIRGQRGIAVGVHLLSAAGAELERDFAHVSISAPVPVGASTTLSVPLPVGRLPAGEYVIEVDLVSEGVAWFEDVGSTIVRRPLVVR